VHPPRSYRFLLMQAHVGYRLACHMVVYALRSARQHNICAGGLRLHMNWQELSKAAYHSVSCRQCEGKCQQRKSYRWSLAPRNSLWDNVPLVPGPRTESPQPVSSARRRLLTDEMQLREVGKLAMYLWKMWWLQRSSR